MPMVMALQVRYATAMYHNCYGDVGTRGVQQGLYIYWDAASFLLSRLWSARCPYCPLYRLSLGKSREREKCVARASCDTAKTAGWATLIMWLSRNSKIRVIVGWIHPGLATWFWIISILSESDILGIFITSCFYCNVLQDIWKFAKHDSSHFQAGFAAE